ncbi:hypothetical protein AWZ03_006451 [Drosophila navojoa]|uniref:AB hydrolase-1 domain-containing protein n=1 Tax=Drosophila navojoa TaxID=7232 RepID=A0A484BEA8_DRONA|nr:probable serine hydrolase [Drosophila navojoa]TDG47186.1 hypothetical protein AWZ03_006451 [Drosophila navojoa]
MGALSPSDYEDVRIWVPWGHIAGRWYGNRSERPILAIHGWLDNLGTFDRLIPLLPDYLGVLCIDLPGHGRSSRLPAGMQYSTADYAFVIARVMKEYGWRKVSLLGHSLGGAISFVYTALAPDSVDLAIIVDNLLPSTESPERLKRFAYSVEKHLVEDGDAEDEPNSYTIDHLRKVLSKGSRNSVPPELAHHLLNRCVAPSQLYPDKFYFTKDNRTKFYNFFPATVALFSEMARRIKNKPILIIKGSKSNYISSRDSEAISILKKQNPLFQFHEVPGTHHVHLVDPEVVAQHIVPFLRTHRPPKVSSWSLDGEKLGTTERENFFARDVSRLSKI